MTRISIVRHGQTEWNLHRRIQGSTDILLNSVGRSQAAETGVRLRERHWDVIVTSPLQRADENQRGMLEVVLGRQDLTDAQLLQGRRIIEETGALAEAERLITDDVASAIELLEATPMSLEGRAALVRLAELSAQRDH